ncbi:MAG: hypothetical protein ACON49_00155 [Candidatus Puniceispirillaceae bacterium]
MKSQLADGCWELLGEGSFKDITMEAVADKCGLSHTEAVVHGGDVAHLVLIKIDELDSKALLISADDFADDPSASVYDKILEGLMMRFEMLAPYRAQFQALHEEATRNPVLAGHCFHQLSHMVGKLLFLAGDETSGPVKQARIIGICSLLLRIRSVWIADETPDLGLTMKALDKALKQACEWAISLRVLSKEDVASGHDG